jgi:antitoxin component HigA of HigAB toxin-antitoxin module
MKASEAYDFVLDKYNIKAKDIAEAIGKSESDVSKFRNGRRKINQDLLQLFIQALPLEARAHFNMLYSYGDEIENIKVVQKSNK